VKLKGHMAGIWEESGINVWYGLQDHFYARELLRRVGPESPAAERFSEMGWAYGDPSYIYGTDPVEVFRHQAGVLAYTLFGNDIALDLLFFFSDEEDLYRVLAEMRDEEGFAISPPCEELLEFAGAGAAYEDAATMIAEFTGEPELIWCLKGALRAVGMKGPMLNHDARTERRPGDNSSHFLLAYDCEPYPEREVIHHQLFDTLIHAWEAMRDATT